jgi:DNA-binding GntR family transcriptional regulator
LRHYYDEAGQLAEMSCSVHPGERFSYTMAIEG